MTSSDQRARSPVDGARSSSRSLEEDARELRDIASIVEREPSDGCGVYGAVLHLHDDRERLRLLTEELLDGMQSILDGLPDDITVYRAMKRAEGRRRIDLARAVARDIDDRIAEPIRLGLAAYRGARDD